MNWRSVVLNTAKNSYEFKIHVTSNQPMVYRVSNPLHAGIAPAPSNLNRIQPSIIYGQVSNNRYATSRYTAKIRQKVTLYPLVDQQVYYTLCETWLQDLRYHIYNIIII